jgi:outer membrane biosynthesis protein TonB
MRHTSLRRTALLLVTFGLTWSAACLYAAEEGPRFGYPEALANATHKVELVYPPSVRPLRIESRVAIDAYVETDGSVYQTIVVCGDLKLVDAAAHAVRQWKFKPFTQDGHPVRAIARIFVEMKPPHSIGAGR